MTETDDIEIVLDDIERALALYHFKRALASLQNSTMPAAVYDAYKELVRGIDVLEGREPTP